MTSVRVACHVHSDWSYDGKWPLQRLAAAFSRRGYQVVLLTEHNQGFDESKRLEHRAACQQASSDDILLVPGIEYSDASNVIHLLVWGNVPFIGSQAEPEHVLAATREHGGVAVLAHPSRKEAWKRFKLEWRDQLVGIEFWNRKTDGWAPSKEAWPLLGTSQALPFAGLDFHDARQFFPLTTVLEIDSPASEAAVIAALRAKRCSVRALGFPARFFSGGLTTKTLHAIEFLRRRAARYYREFAAWKTTLRLKWR
jgi:hypothetical protein